MKRIWILLLALCLLPLSVHAEEGRPLFAVKGENGLWGYIDSRGNLVIPCTFAWAEDFRGDYALACQYPDGFVPDKDHVGTYHLPNGQWMPPEGLAGVIDASGQWVVPPEYNDVLSTDEGANYAGGRDTGVYWFSGFVDGKNKQGFFDIPSGFFSGLIYDGVDIEFYFDMDPELIGVVMDGKLGFANRATGEIVIPCQYDPFHSREFMGDSCMVMPADAKTADGWLLIDRTGREIPLPENCYATGYFSDGLAPVWNSETDLCGYIDMQGNAVIEPKYQWAYEFSEGLACVKQANGEYAMITPDGTVAFTRWDIADSYDSSEYLSHGLIRCAAPDEGFIAFVNKEGKEAFRLEIEGLRIAGDFMENGVAFYLVRLSQMADHGRNAVGLFNDRGEILTPPIFQVYDEIWGEEFSEGLFPAVEYATGKEGFIDEKGQWAFPPVDGYCREFHGGLGRIEQYPDMVFVDRKGREVYRYAIASGEDHDALPEDQDETAREAPKTVYFNPRGGRYYHADRNCPCVSSEYLPLSPIPFALLSSEGYRNLLPCSICGAPGWWPTASPETDE